MYPVLGDFEIEDGARYLDRGDFGRGYEWSSAIIADLEGHVLTTILHHCPRSKNINGYQL